MKNVEFEKLFPPQQLTTSILENVFSKKLH